MILLSVLVIFSVSNKTFSTTFLPSRMMKCFKPSSPKESKKKMSVFGSISSILHQCIQPFSLLSVLAIMKEYLPCFSDIVATWLINLFIWLEGKTPTKLSSKSSSLMFFMAFSIWKLLTPLLIVTRPQKDLIVFFFCLVLCFFHDAVCYVRIQCSLNVFFLIFGRPYLTRFGIFSIPLPIYFFPSTEFIALAPLLIPRLVKFLAYPFPVCALRNLLYIFVILLALSCVGVFTRANLTFFFVVYFLDR